MKRLALAAIRLYQNRLSAGGPLACRFEPTCSHYAYEAIETRGALVGGVMSIWRLLRCNPFNDGGYDPVPIRAGGQRVRHNR